MDDTYEKNKGNSGLDGVQFQLNVLIVCLLNVIRNHNQWKISTENAKAEKFDDIVIELPDETVVLIQVKFKEKKKITREQLLSTNPKKADFSLPKYFFSYQKVKEKFKGKTVIICTNTIIDEKGLENILTPNYVHTNNILQYEDNSLQFFTFSENIVNDLKVNTESYYNNLQYKDIEKEMITNESLQEFVRNLQIFLNYPSGQELKKYIEKSMSHFYNSNLWNTISFQEIYGKVEDWFKQTKGEYLTENRARSMLCEIRSDKYCDELKNYNMSFEQNFNFSNIKRICWIIVEDGYLLHTLKVYRSLQNDGSKKLYINPEDDVEVQKLLIEAFKLPRYRFLIIVCPPYIQESEINYIGDNIKNILLKYGHKKVILIAESNNKLAQKICSNNNVSFINESVIFGNFTKNSQEILLKKNIVFQGNKVNLQKLLTSEAIEEYTKTIHPEILQKLIRDEDVTVGLRPKDLESSITRYYISRTFKRVIDYMEDEQKDNEKRESFPEENVFDVKDKVILIADSAGIGKTTILTKLALNIKENHPHLWVIKVELNDYSNILRELLSSNKEMINVVELLNSKKETKLKSQLEEFVFSMNRKVVLMLDGVDEVSPGYTKLILNLLTKCRQASNFAKIFVTCRPHISRELEQVLEVNPFILQPFTLKNQTDFLTQYWVNNLKIQCENKGKCEKFAKALIEKMSSLMTGEILFSALPLHVRMLAEIFEEGIKCSESMKWEGCKEYVLTESEAEPKLLKEVNITTLYHMFIEKKRDIFLCKVNPTGNSTTNNVILEEFNECLAYHRRLALEAIVFKDMCDLFINSQMVEKNMDDSLLMIGIVQKSNDAFHFVHRTFAEYFVAEGILRELESENEKTEFQRFFMEEMLSRPEFKTIRSFLSNFLQNIDPLPSNIFHNYRLYTYKYDMATYWPNHINPIIVLAKEGCVPLLNLLLKCIQFKIIKCRKNTIAIFYMAGKGNMLDYLQVLVRHNGINFKDLDGYTPLHFAAEEGQFEMAKFLVEQGADVFARDPEGRTAVHLAAKSGELNTIKYLLELDTDNINTKYKNGGTILHSAALSGRLDAIKYLLGRNVDINIKDNDGSTALHLMAKYGESNTVNFLVQHGADINIRDNHGLTVLHLAAKYGHLETVEFFAKLGINTSIRDNGGNTPLHSACKYGELDIVKFLVTHGVNASINNYEGSTALHLAAESGELDTLKYLRELGIDTNIRNNAGSTALHSASISGMLDAIEFLIEFSSDANSRDNGGNTPLLLAVESRELPCVKILIKYGVDANSLDNNNNTALHLAAKNGVLDIIQYLTELNIDINRTNNDGSTVLHLAAENGELDAVKLLTRFYVDPNVRDNSGSTALHLAAENGELEIVKFLIKFDADANIKDNNGNTSLHLAAKAGELDTVKFLTHFGIHKNNDGNTALHVAVESGELDIVEFLLKFGIDINVRNNDGNTALHLAARNDVLDIVTFLAVSDADTNIKNNNGSTSLHLATENGKLNTVKLLAELRVEANIRNNSGNTALHLAAEKADLSITKFLTELEINVNVKNNEGNTALHLAAKSGDLATVTFLVEFGVNTFIRNNDGSTVLHLAAEGGEFDNIKFLANHCAAIDVRDSSGCTSLHLAAKCGNVQIIKFFAELAVNINVKDNGGSTALHLATLHGKFDAVKFLAERNINENVRNNEGSTALHIAALQGHITMVKFFIQRGADITIEDNGGRTPLHLAALNGHLDIIKLFMERDADVTSKDNDGRTAFHLSAWMGRLNIVKYFVGLGVDINTKANDGRTPLHFAARMGRFNVVKYLIEVGVDTNIQDYEGHEASELALMRNYIDIAEFIINHIALQRHFRYSFML